MQARYQLSHRPPVSVELTGWQLIYAVVYISAYEVAKVESAQGQVTNQLGIHRLNANVLVVTVVYLASAMCYDVMSSAIVCLYVCQSSECLCGRCEL